MKRLLWSIFILIILLISIGLASCIQTGDEERPGMAVSTDFLLTKVWGVELFQDDGQNKSSLFHNVFLEFRPNFVFRITQGCEIIDGEWILSNDSTLLVIRLPDSPEPLSQLQDEWVVTSLTETEIHLIEQDNKGDEEFHLKVTPLGSLSCNSCENLSQILVDSVWSITEFSADGREFTDQSRGSYLKFNQSGEVILYSGGDEIFGSWVLTDQCHTLVIQWFEDNIYSDLYVNMQDHWFIHIINPQMISVESEEQGKLELTKGKIPSCTDLHTNMLNTSWSIGFMSINEDNVSDNFLGTGFTLLENNKLATEVVIGPAVLGEWMLSGNCDRLTIDVQAGQLKELSREWEIVEITQDQIVLLYEEGTLSMEMHLYKGKPQPTANCLVFINSLTDRKWTVHKFTENGSAIENYLQGYSLQFMDGGEVLIWNDSYEIKGSWYPVRDCKSIVLDLDREGSAKKLAGKWKIESIKQNRIVMVYEKMGLHKTIELVTL